jgi:hypothetical protein
MVEDGRGTCSLPGTLAGMTRLWCTLQFCGAARQRSALLWDRPQHDLGHVGVAGPLPLVRSVLHCWQSPRTRWFPFVACGFWLPALSRYSRVGRRHSAGEDRETIRTSRSIGVDYDGAQAPETTCTRAEGRPGSATPPEKLCALALNLPAHGGAHTSKDVRISSTLTTCWRRPAAQWRGSCASASTRIINYCPRRPLWRSSLLAGMPQLSGQRYAVLAGFSGPTILTALTSAATAMTSPPTDIARGAPSPATSALHAPAGSLPQLHAQVRDTGRELALTTRPRHRAPHAEDLEPLNVCPPESTAYRHAAQASGSWPAGLASRSGYASQLPQALQSRTLGPTSGILQGLSLLRRPLLSPAGGSRRASCPPRVPSAFSLCAAALEDGQTLPGVSAHRQDADAPEKDREPPLWLAALGVGGEKSFPPTLSSGGSARHRGACRVHRHSRWNWTRTAVQ